MKWRKLILLFLYLAVKTVQAQAPSLTINPTGNLSVCAGTTVNVSATVNNAFAGTTSYAISNITYSPYTVLAGTSLTMPDDTVLGPFPIGFQFCFFGNTYTQFYVGSNGWVGFSPGQTRAFTANSIPNTTTFVPRNCIMGPWMDFNPGIAGGPYIKYQTQGIAPYRRLVVQWTNCPLYQCIASKATFQIVLFESTNVIENYIANKPVCVVWAGGTATQGLHNQAGTTAFAVTGRNASVWTATNDAIRYQPSGPPSYTINWTSNGIPIGTGASASTVVNGPGNTRIIGRVNFQCSNLIVYDTLDVSIGGAASAAFSVPTVVCAGQAANFTYTGGSTGTGAWTFASGTPATASSTGTVSTTWASPGTYNVGLTVTPSSGLCSPGSLTQAVTVVSPPTSTFTLPATICTGANATITYTGTAPAGSTYTWNFGANATPATATGVGPHTVAWSAIGSKTVSLTVAGGTCTSTTTNTISVNSAPTSTFTVAPTTVCVGANSTMTFTGTAAAGASYAWNFGVGATPATANTAGPHTVSWSSSGTKTITLSVTAGGCTSAVTSHTVTVNPVPTATFTMPATVCVGSNASISYTGNGLAPPSASYSWNIGGGGPAPGNVQGPFGVSWASSGTKTVSLTVAQAGCTSSPVSQTINVVALPTVSISASAASTCVGQALSFSTTGAAQPSGTTYSWNFGAGASPTTSTSAGPVSVTWSVISSPTATLTVSSGGCTSSPASASVSIVAPPVSTISAPATGCIGVPVSISAPGPFASGTTFNWNFGTGVVISGSGAGPYIVQWATSGFKPVSLTVTSGACSSSSNVSVDIRSASTASFTVPSTICAGQASTVTFSGSASGTATYLWNFGVGATPATANTAGPHSVTWSSAGSKTISLTLTDGTCTIPVSTQTVTVNPVYTSTFSLPATACTGTSGTINYTGNAPVGASYSWNFGIGATPATASTVGPHSVSWTGAGSKTVSLTVTSAGCSSTTSQNLSVSLTPTASISMASSIGVSSTTPVGLGGAAMAGVTYSWNFGSGASPAMVTGIGPHSVSWSSSGLKTVTLTVSLNGCSSTITQTINVITPSTSSFTAPSSICLGSSATINYTGNASSGALYAWNFDGGTASPGTGVGPHTITWATSGLKTIHLIVTDNGIASSDFTATVNVNPIPTSTFSLPASVCLGSNATITYTGNASSSASYSWNFGTSSSPGTALTSGPHQVNWSSAGSPSVTLSVTENGCSSTPTSSTISVLSPPSIGIAALSAVCENVNASVTLSGSAVSGVTYSWNFGSNASPATATGAGPHSVNWTSSGTKTITLNATQSGCAATPVTSTVLVNSTPSASFTLSNPSCVNEDVIATYTGSAGNSASFNWSYPGASLISGSASGPLQLSWASSGVKQVQLTVTENGCVSTTVSNSTTILDPPSFTISSPQYTGINSSTTITYTGTQPTGASYLWNFAGGTVISGSGAGPYQVQWSSTGTKTIFCTVSLNGCSSVTNSSTTQVVAAAIASFTADSPLCPNEVSTVVFTGFALSSASYTWDFDGGTIISGSGPGPFQISWPSSGTKNISLLVSQLGIDSPLMTNQVIVNPIPTANFTTVDPLCAGNDITFSYTGSASNAANFVWNFGSGVLQDSVQGVSYTVNFSSTGNENVSLVVSENGCVSTPVSLPISIHQVPTANFTASASACEDAPVTLNYTGSASSSAAFSWEYPTGDYISGSSSGPISISYPSNGTQTVSLVVSENGCVSDSFHVAVNIIATPTASFSIVSSGCSADSVLITYTGNASSSATYVWDFESAVGYSGADQGPYSALFPGAGNYPVGLFVMENGCMSAINEQHILLNASPSAAFTIEDTVYVNQTATAVFNGLAPTGTSMTWLYPSANILSGGAGGPIEMNWANAGTYPVSLSVDNAGCSDGPVVHQVVVLNLPASAFTLSEDTLCAGSSITVQYSGIGSSQAQYHWNFDGATIISGSAWGPYEITWPTEGPHTITLNVSVDGLTTPTSSELVQVIGIPVASFDMPEEACAGSEVHATYNSITTLNAQFQWIASGVDSLNLNDPANPILIWNSAGTMNVILNVADAMCISAPFAKTITIHQVPTASFSIPQTLCKSSDFEIDFTGSTIPGATYSWNFGSAEIVSGSNAGPYILNSSTVGVDHITLEVSSNGCTSTLADTSIIVRDLPTVNVGADTQVCSGDTIQLSTLSQANYDYAWLPSTGLSDDSIANPTLTLSTIHNYVETSIYTVQVSDGYCSNSDQIEISIAPKPTASFIHPDGQCFDGNSFEFVPDGSFTSDATFFWNLGSHAYTHSPSDPIQHAISFDTSGTFSVSLSVSQYGCVSDLYLDTIQVFKSPSATFTAHNIKGCVPLTSTFEANSSSAGSTQYTWNFGDGNSSTGANPEHTYESSGYMTVTVTAVDSNGCTASFTEQNSVQVLEQPIAGFRTSPEVVFIGGDELELTSLSENALYCYYVIGNDTILGCTNTYNFTEEGVFPITQVVLNALGCTDEITHTVVVEYGTEYYVPTAFSPNNDGTNDEFKVVGSEIKKFSIIIFDRWGNEIFTSDDIDKGWKGLTSGNELMPEGVYSYRLEMKSKLNKDIVKTGAVTLLR